MLERMPASILRRICIYAIEGVGWLHKPLELEAIRSTCKILQAMGSEVAWRQISVSRRSVDIDASYRALSAIIDNDKHPVYHALRDLYLDMPPTDGETDKTAQIDACLAELLRRTTALARLDIGLDLVQSSASGFPLLTQQLLKNAIPSLRHLRLQEYAILSERDSDPGLTANQLPFLESLSTVYPISNEFQPISIAGFHHLKRLHLALPMINLSEEPMSFPTDFWDRLQDFSLDTKATMLGNWKARKACMIIADSMNAAPTLKLHTFRLVCFETTSLGPKALLEAVRKSSSNLKRLSLCTSILPTTAYCKQLSSHFPGLLGLTIVVHKLDTAYAWPEDAQEYSLAFSRFPSLVHLTVNAGDVPETHFTEMRSRSQDIQLWRVNYALVMGRACSNLQTITFLPYGLQDNTVCISRDRTDRQVAQIDLVKHVGVPS